MFYELLKLGARKHGEENYYFFAIPKSQFDEFYDNPELAFKSLEAKELYAAAGLNYELDSTFHDVEAYKRLDALNSFWQNALVGHDISNN